MHIPNDNRILEGGNTWIVISDHPRINRRGLLIDSINTSK